MSGLWRLRIKAIACHERRYEFTISTQLDKKKITKNTIFHFNNFFSKKMRFYQFEIRNFLSPLASWANELDSCN